MAFDLDDISVIAIAPLGAPGTGVTAGDWTSYKATVDALNARANITRLDDVPDVVLSALADGQVIRWDATSSTWINATSNEAIASVLRGGTDILDHAAKLNFATTMTAAVDGSDGTQVDVGINVGTTSGTIAAGDHVHTPMFQRHWDFAATGLLSSGTRTLVSQSTDVFATGIAYNITARLVVTGRNNINNGSVTLGIKIGTQPTKTRTQTTVGGVPHEMQVQDEYTLTGAGASITILATIAFAANDPTNVDDGYVYFEAIPRR